MCAFRKILVRLDSDDVLYTCDWSRGNVSPVTTGGHVKTLDDYRGLGCTHGKYIVHSKKKMKAACLKLHLVTDYNTMIIVYSVVGVRT